MLKQYFYAKNRTNFLQYANNFTKMSYICIFERKSNIEVSSLHGIFNIAECYTNINKSYFKQ